MSLNHSLKDESIYVVLGEGIKEGTKQADVKRGARPELANKIVSCSVLIWFILSTFRWLCSQVGFVSQKGGLTRPSQPSTEVSIICYQASCLMSVCFRWMEQQRSRSRTRSDCSSCCRVPYFDCWSNCTFTFTLKTTPKSSQNTANIHENLPARLLVCLPICLPVQRKRCKELTD